MRDCEIKPEVSDIGKGVKCASEEAARDREECDSEREGDVHLCCGLVARGNEGRRDTGDISYSAKGLL